jgi:mRNA interferase MazF
LDFSPQLGHEQAKRRSALVLSAASYNRLSGLCVVCPITNTVRNNNFYVPLPAGLPVTGAVISDQVKSLAWQERKAKYVCDMPPHILAEVVARVFALIN